jgi:hypothetical protein
MCSLLAVFFLNLQLIDFFSLKFLTVNGQGPIVVNDLNKSETLKIDVANGL